MGKTLCPDRLRASLAIVATLIVFAWPTAWGQLLAIALGGLIGWRYLQPVTLHRPENIRFAVSKSAAVTSCCRCFAMKWCRPASSMTTFFLRVTVQRRPFQGRFSRLPRISAA